MGVISVGASLGVAERNAGRAPSVSPLAASASAAAASASASASALGSHPHHAVAATATLATTATNAHLHNARGRPQPPHEYSYNAQASSHGGGGGGRPHKRGGRRKYAQNNHAAPFPPPPIVTSAAALAMAAPPPAAGATNNATTPSPVARTIAARVPASAVGASTANSNTHSAPSSPSQIVRVVVFETNVDAQLLVPFVLGGKNGSRLQAFMQQSKCSIAHHAASAALAPEAIVIRVNRSGIASATPSPSASYERRMGFVVTADTTKRVDHGVRLLQGAIETAEQILVRKKTGTPTHTVAAAAVATSVAVDSGGNGKPSSGHASASRAVIPDHSIDDPPPPSRLTSSSSAPAPLSSSGNDIGASHDSVDERKAQTRIRYPPTNQPLKRGPGFAPSRIIAESSTSVATSVPETTNQNVDKAASKKRQLPVSSEETSRGESNKRERTSSQHNSSQLEANHHDLTNVVVSGASCSTDQQGAGNDEATADPEFDEFRIRLNRGIEFAREVDAQAIRVKQRLMREKKKYLQMTQQAQLMKHQQRVADVVIRTQCAIMATGEPSGRKRRRIEQLSAAQDALQKTLHANKRKMTSQILVRKHLPARVPLTSNQVNFSQKSSEISELMKRVAAFRAAVSSKAVDCPSKEELIPPPIATSATSRTDSSVDLMTVPSKQADVMDKSSAASEAPEFGTSERSDRGNQSDVFRPRHLAPGVLRDMNLIQDYTDESDCALLRLLIGQRQYFYLEPVCLSFGTSDLDRLQLEAIRTTNDLELMREFVMKRRRFGVELLKSVESVASNSSQAFASSKTLPWTTMQRSLLELHPLLLVLHLLAIHYHAVTVLEQKKLIPGLPKPDLLSSEDELSSDLFKFVLRPIRSSAIESSLNDSLPISLVRETIAHCPEVVNHVLDWKEESDVPPVLLQDVKVHQSKKDRSSSASSTGSVVLSETLKHLRHHADDFDRNLSELARHLQGLRNGNVSGDKVVHLVNQLKALGAQLFVANTQLQLHKWATVFVENGFSWIDEDMDDDGDGDNVMGGDRSYDKFTCLQDALYVWHNTKLKYSAKDACGDDIGDVVEPEGEDVLDQTNPEQDDPELAQLRRVTPADVLNIVETKFTDAKAVASFYLTSQAIAQTRSEFNDSLSAMRASMKVLGRTAPWRTHVKHSNILKVEYTKQRELENKLLLHQWATYYKNRPLPSRHDILPCTPEEAKAEVGSEGGDEKNQRGDDVDQPANVNEPSSSPSSPITDPGIVLEPGDTPEVVDMKLLRHEIENVAKQMHSMGDNGAVDADRKKLLDACNLLAASCVSALTKFLSQGEPAMTADSSRTSHVSRAARNRANSASKVDNVDADHTSKDPAHPRSQPKSKQRAKGRAVGDEYASSILDSEEKNVEVATDGCDGVAEADSKCQPVASTKRSKKGSAAPQARRPRAHSTSSASPRAPPTAPPLPAIQPLPSRASASKVSPSHSGAVAPLLAEPLRMGCSGCRDTRRRCTGCHGCCLHCVCVGCGCRMCCSSRTSAVKKTLTLLVTAVETRMGCKWIELDSIADHNERCGMVKACSMCQQCSEHCKCHPSAQASNHDHEASTLPHGAAAGSTAPATAGFPSSATRKERRFRINPTAAQRRQNQASGGSDEDSHRRPTSAGASGHSATKRTRRSNSDATPSMFKDDSVDSTTASDFMSSDQFSGSSTDGIPFSSANPLPAQHRSEQEDLFRAARVRMKLQRNTILKASHPYGLIPPNTLIEGEMLWHPDRIRLMWERKDVYGVLGVPRDASSQLIKKQYRKLVLKLHPDKVSGTNDSTDATSPNQSESWSLDDRVSAFVAVTKAYKLLSGEIGAIHNNAWKTTPTAL